MALRNKRYIVWFWLLSLALTWVGTSPFRESAHVILDHSFVSDRLLHGFDLSILLGLIARPEFGSTPEVASPAASVAFLFFLATALFLPGVFAGYASTYRLPRDDFFRACGRNLWRFIRLMIVSGIVMIPVTVILFMISGVVGKKAAESTNELLPFTLQVIALIVIFLIMSVLRIWFDLAEADVVLNDQRAVRKSIAAGFRHTFRSLGRLLAGYVVATIVAAIVLVLGLWCWLRLVPAEGVWRAFLLSQLILMLLLIPRFWQRGVAVSYWQQYMLVPLVPVKPIDPTAPAVIVPQPVAVVSTPEPDVPAPPSATTE